MGNWFKRNNSEQTNRQEQSSENLIEQDLNELKRKTSLLEQRLLNKFTYPLNNNSIYYEDIPILFQGENTYLHTLIYGLNELKENPDTPKKVIIMLHGYQGSSANFYKIIPYIHSKFICICPDIIGMGLSSRVKVEFTSNEQCINFFIESIEAFRKSLEQNYNLKKKFILCGHSLGGYLATTYCLNYPQYIESMFLMSPTGITDVEKYGGNIMENMSMPLALSMKSIYSFWKNKPTIQDYSQTFLIKNIISYTLRKRYSISQEENDILGEITELTLKYPKDLDTAIYFIFKYPFPTAVVPLEDIIKEKIGDMHFIFCYGEKDWMDNSGAKRLNSIDNTKYKYFTVYNAGHTFLLDNPGDVAKIIINEL